MHTLVLKRRKRSWQWFPAVLSVERGLLKVNEDGALVARDVEKDVFNVYIKLHHSAAASILSHDCASACLDQWTSSYRRGIATRQGTEALKAS